MLTLIPQPDGTRARGVTPAVLALLESLIERFEPRRAELLARRGASAAGAGSGPATRAIRERSWRVPAATRGRRPVEVVGVATQPRDWCEVEWSLTADGAPISATLFDAGLSLDRDLAPAVERGLRVHLVLPPVECRREAALWRSILHHCEVECGVPTGSVTVTAVIDKPRAYHELDEILYELGPYAGALACPLADSALHARAALVAQRRGAPLEHERVIAELVA